MTLSDWLNKFQHACNTQDSVLIDTLFEEKASWRDYLGFDLTLQTFEGKESISHFCLERGPLTNIEAIELEETPSMTEGAFTFNTSLGKGRGYVRLHNGLCQTLFTSLLNLDKVKNATPVSTDSVENFVLVVGGGQSGLALGAQLSHLGIPYLVIDKYPRVGDQWRSRYESLVLHDPVWYDHLPFIPYPDSWPTFTPKDQMGDWLESYSTSLKLNVSTETTLKNAKFDERSACWKATIEKNGVTSTITATHLVMALGLSGFPHVPKFEGMKDFCGQQLHSSEFKASSEMKGSNVVVIGANNSAHDIASDLVSVGANPIMLQRSSTLVVKQSVYCEKLLGKLYSKEAVSKGISADEADFLFTSVPMKLLEERHRELWKEIHVHDKKFYEQLDDAGFNLDFAEDGAGLGLKYRRTASGYYIDVGASEKIVKRQIRIRSGVNVSRLSKNEVHLDNGESISADMVVYATGYGNMVDWLAKLVDEETAKRVGPCWGYGSDTKGDPGPWIGELRNMWMPTAQEGLWFMGGNLAQVRYFSRILALQLQAKYLQVSTVD